VSFDVDVGDWSANYTSNMGAFFAWAIQGVDSADPASRCDSRDVVFGERPVDGLSILDGLPAGAVAMKLRKALDRIEAAPEEQLEKFNAPNGWGHHVRATDFLWRILRACNEHPDAKVRVLM
jgi:hypothetical protein